MHPHTHTHMHTDMHAHTDEHAHMDEQAHTHTDAPAHTYPHVHAHTDEQAHRHAHMDAHMDAPMHTHPHAHAYPGSVDTVDSPRVPPLPCGRHEEFEGRMSREASASTASEALEPEQRRGRKWKSIKRAGTSMKKYLRRKMAGGSGSKNDVMEVHIRPEDDTDYTKQWSRRMHRAQTFDSEGKSCSSQSSSAKSRDSEKSRDLEGSRSKSPEAEEDGILVVHDAEDDLDLTDLDL